MTNPPSPGRDAWLEVKAPRRPHLRKLQGAALIEFNLKHPRDRKGRFIETGGIARMWGGLLVRVLGMGRGANGRPMVRVEDRKGRTRMYDPGKLTMIARPDGSKPTASKTKVQKADADRDADPLRPNTDQPELDDRVRGIDLDDEQVRRWSRAELDMLDDDDDDPEDRQERFAAEDRDTPDFVASREDVREGDLVLLRDEKDDTYEYAQVQSVTKDGRPDKIARFSQGLEEDYDPDRWDAALIPAEDVDKNALIDDEHRRAGGFDNPKPHASETDAAKVLDRHRVNRDRDRKRTEAERDEARARRDAKREAAREKARETAREKAREKATQQTTDQPEPDPTPEQEPEPAPDPSRVPDQLFDQGSGAHKLGSVMAYRQNYTENPQEKRDLQELATRWREGHPRLASQDVLPMDRWLNDADQDEVRAFVDRLQGTARGSVNDTYDEMRRMGREIAATPDGDRWHPTRRRDNRDMPDVADTVPNREGDGRDRDATGGDARTDGGTPLEDVAAPPLRADDRPGADSTVPRPEQPGRRGGEADPDRRGVDTGRRGDTAGEDAPGADGGVGGQEQRDPRLDPARPGAGDSGAGRTDVDGDAPDPEMRGTLQRFPDAPRFNPRSQDDLAPNSTKERARANIDALRTLRRVQSEGRPATPEEQRVLARWSGWGALSEPIFGDNPRNVREFAAERAEITNLLTPDELALARRNALNAHYTDISLVDEVWDFLADAGITEGTVLEPGSGSGNFMARRPDGVQMVGVEFDPITAGISQLLYPDAVVINDRIEQVDLPDQGFDAVVGNVPFQRARMYDPVYSPQRQHNLHNLSIIKSLDKTRPGGLMAVVTSAGTMDAKRSRDSRRAMHDKADLVAAIRMPAGAHKRAAGTDVVTDLLIFRRRGKDEKPGDDTWVDDVREIGEGPDGKKVYASGYFVDNPQQVLGEMKVGGGLNAAAQMTVDGDPANTPRALRNALNRAKLQMVEKDLLPTARTGDAPAVDLDELTAEKVDLPEAYIGVDPGDVFYEVRGGRKVPVNVPKAQRVRARKLIELGDVADRLLAEQSAHEDETPAAVRLRKQLNKLYDSYVKRYGAINKGKMVGSSPKDDYYGKADDDERTPLTDTPVADLAEWQIIEIPGRWDAKGNRARAIVKSVDPDRGVATVSLVGARTKAEQNVELPIGGRPVTVVGERTPTFRVELEAPKIVQGSALAGLIFALDSYDMETGESGKSTLLTGRTLQARPINYVEQPVEVPRRLADPDGRFTLAEAASLMGVDEGQARDLLRGHAFLDHTDPTRMVERSRYLGGAVRQRLRAAQRAAVKNPELRENVAALEQVVPEEKPAHKIKVRPGASWIPEDVVRDFLGEILEDPDVKVKRLYGSTWSIEPGSDGKQKRVIATQTWGYGGHWNAYNIMDSLVHNRPIRVTKTVEMPDGSKKTVFDQEATDAVQAKADALREKFADWIFNSDPERAEQLFRDYNDTFNGLVPTQYSTDPYHPPGMAQMLGEQEFSLRGHQAAMVRRSLAEPGALAAHEVGAGKTFTAATIAMELRRMGLANKPGIVVPKHLKEQWHREFLSIFPQAKVLAVSSEDLKGPDARRRFMGKVAAGDWDAVIFTFDSYKSIPMSRQGMRRFKDKKMAAKRAALDAARQHAINLGENPDDSKTVKDLEAQLLAYEQKLDQYLASARDDGIEWERLGIDYLIVDEAHKYKNLERLSRTDEALEGGPYTVDMDMKLGHIRETSTTNRHATFLTATPISNSIGEMYTMLQYLRPDLLEEQGIVDFDSFLVNYADQKTRMEMRPAGDGYAPKARFRDWFNLPGLQRTWLQVADVQTGDDLDLDVPDIDGGSPEMVVAAAPSSLPEYMQHLADRAASAGGGKGEDNILVINGDGSAAALDPRMVGLDAPEEGTGKLAAATDKITEIYEQTKTNRYVDKSTGREHPNEGALQLVFLDIGTPGAKGGQDNPDRVSEQVEFNAYEELRQMLAARGVPAEKIAFIHEAKNDKQRAAMFKKARSGEIAVLIGSTPMMGTGVNVQDRAVALHHLDAPYRPSDIQQRDGRAVRQGNQNSKVRVIRYTTAGSLDARKWQIQESKARMVESLMRGDLDMDEAEMGDLGGQATVNAQELAAITADDPVLLAKLDVDLKVNELQTKRRTLENAQSMASGTVQRKVDAANRAEENVAKIDEVRGKVKKRGGDDPITGYEIEVDGVDGGTLKKRADINDSIREVVKEKVWNAAGIGDGDSEVTPIGTVGGFQVVGQTRYNWMEGKRSLHVWMPDIPDSELEALPHSMIDRTDFVGRLERKLDDLDDRRDMYAASIPQLRKEADQARALIGQGFEQQEELDAYRQRQRRLDELMGWMAGNKDAKPEAIPEHLRSDPPNVVEKIGAIDTDRKEIAERPPASSLSNITPDGEIKPRDTKHLRRKVAGAKKTPRKPGTSGKGGEKKPTKPRNPKFGKPAGEPVLLREGPSQTRINQPIHGRNEGQVVDKTVWVVQRDGDGVWGAYPPTHQVPDRTFGGRREAEDWAMARAKGVPDPDAPEPDEPTLLDQEQVADTIEDLGGDRPQERTPSAPDAPDVADLPASSEPELAPEQGDRLPDSDSDSGGPPAGPVLDPADPAAYLEQSTQEAVDADPDVAEADTDTPEPAPNVRDEPETFTSPEGNESTPDIPEPDAGPEPVATPVRETPDVPPTTETPDTRNTPAGAADEPWRDPRNRYGRTGVGAAAEQADWEALRDMVGRGDTSIQALAILDRDDLVGDPDAGLTRFPAAWNDVVKPDVADRSDMPYETRAARLDSLAAVLDQMMDEATDDGLRERLDGMVAQAQLMRAKAANAAEWEKARREGRAKNPRPAPTPAPTPEPQQQADTPDVPEQPDTPDPDADEAEIVDARGAEGQMEGQQALGGGTDSGDDWMLQEVEPERQGPAEVEGQTDIFGQVADAEPAESPDAPETPVYPFRDQYNPSVVPAIDDEIRRNIAEGAPYPELHTAMSYQNAPLGRYLKELAGQYDDEVDAAALRHVAQVITDRTRKSPAELARELVRMNDGEKHRKWADLDPIIDRTRRVADALDRAVGDRATTPSRKTPVVAALREHADAYAAARGTRDDRDGDPLENAADLTRAVAAGDHGEVWQQRLEDWRQNYRDANNGADNPDAALREMVDYWWAEDGLTGPEMPDSLVRAAFGNTVGGRMVKERYAEGAREWRDSVADWAGTLGADGEEGSYAARLDAGLRALQYARFGDDRAVAALRRDVAEDFAQYEDLYRGEPHVDTMRRRLRDAGVDVPDPDSVGGEGQDVPVPESDRTPDGLVYDKDVRYVHANQWNRPKPDDNTIVWNAPRPLVGADMWEGDFVSGIFYASARRDDPNFERWAELNRRDGAVEVRVVNNAEVLQLHQSASEQSGSRYTVKDYLDNDLSPAEAMVAYNLPWSDDDDSAEPLIARLREGDTTPDEAPEADVSDAEATPEPDVTPDEAPEPAAAGGAGEPPRTPPAGPVPGDAEDQPAPDPDLPEQAEQPDARNEPLIGQAGTSLSADQLAEGARILADSDAAVKAHSDEIGPRKIPQINTGGGRSKTPLKITPDDTLTGGIKVEKARGLADNEFSEVNENLRRNGFWWDKGRRAWVHRSNFPRYRDGRSVNYADTDAAEVRRWAADSGMVDEADAKPKMRTDPMYERYAPTEQQAWVGQGFFAGARRIVASAMAGTGKTTTLVALARRIKLAQPDRRGIHLAFNKSVAEDVVQKMPDNVAAVTGDALAWNAIAGKGKPMANRWRRRDIRPGERGALLKNYDDIARRLGLRDLTTDGRRPGPGDNPDDLWTAGEQARTVQQIVEKYAISADDEIGSQHLPDGMTGALADMMLEKANAYWDDLNDPDGDFFITNSHLTKMWALTRPDLTKRGSIGGLVPRTLGINSLGDDGFIFFDEAQDINSVMGRVIADQKVQVIYVGDPNQAIYGFRGASDEMSRVDADHTAQIDVTHRFGEAMTDPGNRFMQLSGSPNRVVGAGSGGEVMEPGSMPVETADAVLSRSNAGAIAEILQGQEAGRLVGVPKGVKSDLRNLVLTARWMRDPGEYRQPNIIHEDLSPFRNWREFEKAVERTGDPKLSMLHRIVSDYDDTALLAMVDQLIDLSDDADTRKPDLVVSTAHKSKGLEWGRVKVAGDFRAPEVNDDGSITWPDDEELRLAYVALTRGMTAIDPGSLAWVYGYTDENGGLPGSKPSKVSDVEWQRLMDRPERAKFRRMAVPDGPEPSTISDEPEVVDETPTIRDGEVGMMFSPGEVVRTASGRETTPFPNVDMTSPRKTTNTVKRVDKWLIDNAKAEADSRGLPEWTINTDVSNLSPADRDTAERVLFDKDWLDLSPRPQVGRPLAPAIDEGSTDEQVADALDEVDEAEAPGPEVLDTPADEADEPEPPVLDESDPAGYLDAVTDEAEAADPDLVDTDGAPDVEEAPEDIPADIPAAPEADATPPAPEPELVATPVRRTPRANNDRVVDVTRDGDVYGTVEAVMDPDRPKKVDHHRVLRGDTEVGTLHKAGKSRHRAQRADGSWVGTDGSEDGAKRFESRNAAALALLEDAGHTTPEARGDQPLPDDTSTDAAPAPVEVADVGVDTSPDLETDPDFGAPDAETPDTDDDEPSPERGRGGTIPPLMPIDTDPGDEDRVAHFVRSFNRQVEAGVRTDNQRGEAYYSLDQARKAADGPRRRQIAEFLREMFPDQWPTPTNLDNWYGPIDRYGRGNNDRLRAMRLDAEIARLEGEGAPDSELAMLRSREQWARARAAAQSRIDMPEASPADGDDVYLASPEPPGYMESLPDAERDRIRRADEAGTRPSDLRDPNQTPEPDTDEADGPAETGYVEPPYTDGDGDEVVDEAPGGELDDMAADLEADVPADADGDLVRRALAGEFGDDAQAAAIEAAGDMWDGADGQVWLAGIHDRMGDGLPDALQGSLGTEQDAPQDVTPDVVPDAVPGAPVVREDLVQTVAGVDEYGDPIDVEGEIIRSGLVVVNMPWGKAKLTQHTVRTRDGDTVKVITDRDTTTPPVPPAGTATGTTAPARVRRGMRVTDGARQGRVTDLIGDRAAVRWDDGTTSNETASSLDEVEPAPSGLGITVGTAEPGSSISIPGTGVRGTVTDTDGDGELVVTDPDGIPHRVDTDPDLEVVDGADDVTVVDEPGTPVDTPPVGRAPATVNFGALALGDDVEVDGRRGTVTNVAAAMVDGQPGAEITLIDADGDAHTLRVGMDSPISRHDTGGGAALVDALDRGARRRDMDGTAGTNAAEVVDAVDDPDDLDGLADSIDRSVDNRYPEPEPGEQAELGLGLPELMVDGKPVRLTGGGDPLAHLRGLTPEQVRERLTTRRLGTGEGVRPDGTVESWRLMQARLDRMTARRMAQSARNARPFPGESKKQAAQRMKALLSDQEIAGRLAESLRMLGHDDEAEVFTPSGTPEQQRRWWQRQLPADRDKVGTRRVRSTDGAVRDRVDVNLDGTPGETGEKHVRALQGSGAALAAEVDRGVAGALAGRWGENPQQLVDDLARREADFGALYRQSGDDLHLRQWQLARDELEQARRDMGEARTAAIGRALEVLRVMGVNNMRLDGPDDRLTQVRQAERMLPADWTLDRGRWLTEISELLGRTERVRSKRWRLAKRLGMGGQSGDARSAMIALADDVQRQNKPIAAAMRVFNARRVQQNKDVLSLGTLLDMLYTAHPGMGRDEYHFALGLLTEM